MTTEHLSAGAEDRAWTIALHLVDPTLSEERAAAAAGRLRDEGIRPEELRTLIDEYERLGPGGNFPGFPPGREGEIAEHLGGVRSKLLDLMCMHDSPHPDHVPMRSND